MQTVTNPGLQRQKHQNYHPWEIINISHAWIKIDKKNNEISIQLSKFVEKTKICEMILLGKKKC